VNGVVVRCASAVLVAAAFVVGTGSAAGPASNGRILFTDEATPGFTGLDFFTVNPDGSDRRQLTSGGRNSLGALSPNGERLAFVKSDGSPPRDLYVMNADGTGGALLIASHPRTTSDDEIRAIAWSPDSGRIAYLHGASPPIRVVDARDGSPFPLQQTGDPVPQGRRLEWSPDGTELLYDAEDDFWTKPVDGRPARRVVALEGPDAFATWSPDGTRIAFVRAASEAAGGVYVVNRDGTDLRHVAATGTAPIGSVRWKPDGTAVVFEATRHEGVGPRNIPLTTTSILVAGAEGSVVRHLRDHAGRPIPSPDNSQLLVQAFGVAAGGGETWRQGVYSMNADGTCLTFVTSGTGIDWQRVPAVPINGPRECVDLVVAAEAPGVTGLRGVPYSITVRNGGTLTASNVRLDLRFDVDVRFLFDAADRRVCSARAASATCQIGRLAPAQAFDVAVTVRPGTPVPLTAEISASSGARDSDPATNSISPHTRVYPCWISGTDFNDVLRGTPAGEEICGRAGDDVIEGLEGADRLDGGWGRDTIVGGAGRDRLVGGRGNDTIHARDGERDTIECGWGDDRAVVDRLDRVLRGCERVERR
jgi:hypothetical protein